MAPCGAAALRGGRRGRRPYTLLRGGHHSSYSIYYYSSQFLHARLSHRPSSRAVPRREQLRTFRDHDARAIRNRVPGHRGRQDVDRLSIPLQTAKRAQGTGPLRAVSAAIRVEPVVRDAGLLDRQSLGAQHGSAAVGESAGGLAALRRQAKRMPDGTIQFEGSQ